MLARFMSRANHHPDSESFQTPCSFSTPIGFSYFDCEFQEHMLTQARMTQTDSECASDAVVLRYGEVFGTQDGGESWLEMALPQGVQHIYALACG
jgi:hypothetical protein